MRIKGILTVAGAVIGAVGASVSASAAVTIDVAGVFGATRPGNTTYPAIPFSGTLTYDNDPSKITYRSGTTVSYGSYRAARPDLAAGSYAITVDGTTYSSDVATINTRRGSCFSGTATCFEIDMLLKSAVTNAADGRLYVLMDPVAPFDGNGLPDTAISSANVLYAFLELPDGQQLTRRADVGDSRGSAAPTPGSTLNFSAAASAVPEPATWGMMIVGFGLVGSTIRRRSQVRQTVRHA